MKKNTNVLVVINENHSLFPAQEAELNALGKWERFNAPASGWSLADQMDVARELGTFITGGEGRMVVFASPIPALLKFLARDYGNAILVFHNDRREKKELPNGRVIMTVAKEGWQLV